MAVSVIKFLEELYATTEFIYIEAQGSGDYAGRAMSRMSDGSYRSSSFPIGTPIGQNVHKAKVEPMADKEGWIVTPWQDEPFEVTPAMLRKLQGEG